MTTIYCFSGSGHSLAVSKVLSEMLACEIVEIGFNSKELSKDHIAVVVFPVYCQNIPSPVKIFLKKMCAKHIVLIATYGKISYGNVLYEAQQIVRGEIIAGAYIPMGHTFLDEDYIFDTNFLLPIVDRINAPQKANISKTRKNPLSNIFPSLRSRIIVKLTKTDHCNNCGICEAVCPVRATQNHRIHLECIRCMRCVTNCPQKALQYQNSWILKKYLNGCHKQEYVLYL